jgi:hypothetical protein
MSKDDTTIVHGTSTKDAALRYAHEQALPINATVEVRDINDRPHTFQVERSIRSQGLLDGGGIRMREILPPLRGGGQAKKKDHIMHARTPAQAALLFAHEADLPPGTHLSVESQPGQKQFFQTPK